MIPLTPWLERKFQFDFPVGLFAIIYSRLEGSRLQQLLQKTDEEYCSQRMSGWSVKDHVGHLYDLEELWWNRLMDFQQNKAVLTAADMTNAKTNNAEHNEKTLGELLILFETERQKILNTVISFDEEMLNKRSEHPRLKTSFRLIDSLFFVAEHDDHHIAHITTLLCMQHQHR